MCSSLLTFEYSIWLLFLVNGFRGAIMASLLPYVTSEWQLHSLLNVVGIVSSSMTAAVYIPMAKVLDVWGRAEGFLLMLSFSVIGLAIAAGSQNLPTFCAAQVGVYDGRGTIKTLISDLGLLLNRQLRSHLCHLCSRSRCDQPPKSRIGLCIHLFALHDYSIRWFQGR